MCMQDIIAIGIAAVGYFIGAVTMISYAPRWDRFNDVQDSRTGAVASSARATSVSLEFT